MSPVENHRWKAGSKEQPEPSTSWIVYLEDVGMRKTKAENLGSSSVESGSRDSVCHSLLQCCVAGGLNTMYSLKNRRSPYF